MYKIFLGSSTEGKKYAEAIKTILKENPLFEVFAWWDKEGQRAGYSYFGTLFEYLHQVDYAIFVGTPDDLLIKRKKAQTVVRDNVLFEYGMFAGHLGRCNALFVQVGVSEMPSDLDGITIIRVAPSKYTAPSRIKTYLKKTVDQCTNYLLSINDTDIVAAINDFRMGAVNDLNGSRVDFNLIRTLLAKTLQEKNRNQCRANLTPDELSILINNYRIEEDIIVGDTDHTSTIDDYIDFTNITNGHLDELVSSFLHYALPKFFSSKIYEEETSRFAICTNCDTNVLGEVIARLRSKPAIVKLGTKSRKNEISGICIQDEKVVYIHDFIQTGFRPLKAVETLETHGAKVTKVFTFFIREKQIDRVKKHFNDNGIEFFYMFIQKGGSLIEMSEDVK